MNVVAAPRRNKMPTPMKKMPGMIFHDASRATRAYAPQAIHTSPTASRKKGFDGRFPGWTGRSGGGADRGGVVRPPFFLRCLATRGTLVVVNVEAR